MSKPWYKDWAKGEWAEFLPAVGPVPSGQALIIIVRHGERLDEADKKAWRQMEAAQPQYFHDPPLTDQGIAQAARAATGLAAELAGIDCSVFASPSVRTLATAGQIAMALAKPVQPVLGLYCCAAAAQNYGVNKLQLREPSDPEFARASAARAGAGSESPGGRHWQGLDGGTQILWPPEGDAKKLSANRTSAFIDTVQALAARSVGRASVLVVHREGFYDPDSLAGVAYAMPPYCGVSRYLVDPSNNQWTKVGPGKWGAAPAPPTLRRSITVSSHASSDEPKLIPVLPTNELQKALDVGFGWVVIDRKEGEKTTCLWKSPGKRGDWVDTAGVPAGEVVEIIRGRVTDSTEGDFVEVQRRNGQTGYAKVKNLWMPDIVMGDARAFVTSPGSPALFLYEDGTAPATISDGTEVDLLKLDDEYAQVALRDDRGKQGYIRLANLVRDAAGDDDGENNYYVTPSQALPAQLLVCRIDGIANTYMWIAPGSRGPPWAPGGAIENGELVTVLDRRVISDPTEGTFVKARRSSGQEGFFKTKNLHVPLREGGSVAPGQDVLHCRIDAGMVSTGLWPAPGVGRDQWVGFVKCGELIQVVEGPTSTDSEGDFLRVQRYNGVQGWLKLKNLHLPLAGIV